MSNELEADTTSTMSQRDEIPTLGKDFLAFWGSWNALPRTDSIPHLGDYLDRVEPTLQPNVVIIDLFAPDEMQVRLTGTAIVEFAGEITGSHADALYQGQIRTKAMAVAWTAVNHPCAYYVGRTLRSQRGLMIVSMSLVVPVITDTPNCKTLIGYSELPVEDVKLAQDYQIETVQDFGEHTWLDVGKGVPT